MPGNFILSCSLAPFFRFVLARLVAILGQSAECDFVIDDPTISRRHAELMIKESEWLVTDLNSRNGTFVEKQRIQTSQISRGQAVSFGSVQFVVSAEAICSAEDAETAIPPPTPGDNGPSITAVGETLSEAQRKVFDLLLTGSAEKTIARRLHLSQHTVHNHVRTIFRIKGVHSRAELFALLLQQK